MLKRVRLDAPCLALLSTVALACGGRGSAGPAAAPSSEPVRAVVQTHVEPETYVVQTESGRFAVFGRTVVDLSVRRVSRTDLEGVLGVPATGHQVYRNREQNGLALFDLRTGDVAQVSDSEAGAIVRRAPVQHWTSHEGIVRNDALAQLTAETRATVEALRSVEPAIVLDIGPRAERLLTATMKRVCLWSLRNLVREECAPRSYQNYTLRADGSLRVSQTPASGEEQVGTLRTLSASVEWHAAPRDEAPASLEFPCDLELWSGPSENVFRRTGRTLFTLHDFGPDGWAIVLPDGRYLADPSPPPGLAFFAADGTLLADARVRALHQPEAVRAALRRGRRLAECAL